MLFSKQNRHIRSCIGVLLNPPDSILRYEILKFASGFLNLKMYFSSSNRPMFSNWDQAYVLNKLFTWMILAQHQASIG